MTDVAADVTGGIEPVEAPAAAPEAPAPAAPDFDALVGRIGDALEPRFAQLEERITPGEAEPVLDPDDPNFYGPADYVGGELTPEAQDRAFWAQVQQEARRIAEEQVKTAIAPIQAERRDERMRMEADALEQRYSELRDEAVQTKVLDEAARRAGQIGLSAGEADALARSPQFIEVVYLAMKAQEAQAAAVPAPAAPSVALEQGGAAGPSGEAAPVHEGDAIVAAGQVGRFRLGMQ